MSKPIRLNLIEKTCLADISGETFFMNSPVYFLPRLLFLYRCFLLNFIDLFYLNSGKGLFLFHMA